MHNNQDRVASTDQLYIFKDLNEKVLAAIPLYIMQQVSQTLGDHAYDGYADQYSFIINIDKIQEKKDQEVGATLPKEALLYLFDYINSYGKVNNKEVVKSIKASAYPLDILDFAHVYGFDKLQEHLIKTLPQFALRAESSLENLIARLNLNSNKSRSILFLSKRYRLYRYTQAADIITHAGWGKRVAISNDNNFIVACSDNGIIKLYDKITHINTDIMTYTNAVSRIAISNDNNFIVTCSHDGTVKLYDIKTKNATNIIAHDNWIRDMAISNDNNFAVSGSDDNKVKLYDIKAKNVTDIITHTQWVRNIAISNDSNFIVSCSGDGIVKLYDRITNITTDIITYANMASTIAISNDNNFIVACSDDGRVKIYDRITNTATDIITHGACVNSIAISNDNSFIVSGANDGSVKMVKDMSQVIDKEFFEYIESVEKELNIT